MYPLMKQNLYIFIDLFLQLISDLSTFQPPTSTPPPVFSSHLQAFDLGLLKLQFGLQFTDLGLLPANKRFLHHRLFLEIKLALEGLHLRQKHIHIYTTIHVMTPIGWNKIRPLCPNSDHLITKSGHSMWSALSWVYYFSFSFLNARYHFSLICR